MPRTNYLNVKLSTQEREKFEAAANDQGLSLGEYARQGMTIKYMMDAEVAARVEAQRASGQSLKERARGIAITVPEYKDLVSPLAMTDTSRAIQRLRDIEIEQELTKSEERRLIGLLKCANEDQESQEQDDQGHSDTRVVKSIECGLQPIDRAGKQ